MSNIISTEKTRELVNKNYTKCDKAFENLRTITKRLKARNEKLRNKLGVEEGYTIGSKEYKASESPYEKLKEINKKMQKRTNKISDRLSGLDDGKAI